MKPKLWFQRPRRASICRHWTRRAGKIEAFGDSTYTQMPKHPTHCLSCIQAMAIMCAWCSEAIFIGDPITLYTPKPDYTPPEHSVTFSTDPVRLVGCMRWDCAITGAERAGFWLPGDNGRGRVDRVPTAFEHFFGDQAATLQVVASSNPTKQADQRTSQYPIP